ncbi:hypothetical protein [Micromonospora sp. WMMD712]|uniref:hypothetical protein n=1 Tax=Micromonospora sp. WMMD712 TaxID=3016096 RepID=UPI00249CA805|nr:hypothetical protein [Micromonospora sp. WMMD712]WFE59336.1 hypothetical protein O7633_21930 [Micromonospora sp. WMMD712]
METGVGYDQDSRVVLHPLVYLADGDEVTIGRRDIDSYGVFPSDGAELVRRLAAGDTPNEVDRWYRSEYGESADIEHVLAALDELGFIAGAEVAHEEPGPVRGQRLGAVLFSRPALLGYGLLVAWAVLAMVRSPDLAPTYRHLFFTEYFTVIELALAAGALPLIVLHEVFHVLAARRLGLRSRVSIGRRFYYVVLETNLDGLVTVPRRQRYLPILAGMLLDGLAFSTLTLAADLTRSADGAFSPVGRVCLALAFATLLRLAWQLFLYLRTDLYVLVTTLLGCVDLHTTAKRLLRNRVLAAVGRRDRMADESQWHPVDRRVARWYSWLVVAGYTFSLALFVVAVAPAIYRMFAGAIGRFSGATSAQLIDSTLFLGLNLSQVLFTVWLAARERRQRRAQKFQHVIA